MWLLNCRTKALVEFDNEDTKPPYAILSHTWIKNEEITYQDIQSGNPRQISGWEKVKACCKRAIEDGFDYCWVDTCCINKTSSAELSEAINSMFQWYADAEVCYAFLTDVDSMVDTDEFESSRWFSRGWTLQELLAPRKVIFFSREWKPIGTRETLKARISRTTKIHEDALTGDVSEIRKFSVAQRMSWASPRTTTRSEDVAYCVLGLFNVNMPLLYGEGKKAFIRLQEEIMKDSDDQSIFSWQRPAGSDLCGMLAPAPSNFRPPAARSWSALSDELEACVANGEEVSHDCRSPGPCRTLVIRTHKRGPPEAGPQINIEPAERCNETALRRVVRKHVGRVV